jgi:hypothetical protein
MKADINFSMKIDEQSQLSSSDKLSIFPEFDLNFNEDATFDSLVNSPSMNILSFVPEGLSDDSLKQILNPSEISGLGNNYSNLHSSTSNSRRESLQRALQNIPSCSPTSRTCMFSALKVLQELHTRPSMCLSAGAEQNDSTSLQAKMTDSVLSINREAGQILSAILKCSCSSSSQLQLLLTIACGKIIAWYRAMLHNNFDQFQSSSEAPWSLSHTNASSPSERVLHQPISLGEYSFDSVLENKIRAQIVFSELQHVDNLIESLLQRVAGTKFGNEVTARARPGDARHAESIHQNLTTFLHQQSQTVKNELSIILNSGPAFA